MYADWLLGKGLLWDFDMNYFLQPGVDIDGFDPAFKKYYNNVFGDNQNPWHYIPTNPLDSREGIFATWTQTSPDDGAWCFKLFLKISTPHHILLLS